ncbi:MAG: hypothetical protein IH946_00785 [Bacteroidetes bacterium]|nr:hypothetical protein [Bacteroidota bacterium]
MKRLFHLIITLAIILISTNVFAPPPQKPEKIQAGPIKSENGSIVVIDELTGRKYTVLNNGQTTGTINDGDEVQFVIVETGNGGGGKFAVVLGRKI